MKIEKINDNQIRCTLTREDLASRELKLSELAYGSDKAKALFRDMMLQAARDFGFEAENTPLVIEAIPVSMDSLILIITKVEDPEELDTRFSRFSPEGGTGESTAVSTFDFKDKIEGADDILGLIKHITEAKRRALQAAADESKDASGNEKSSDVSALAEEDNELRNLTRFYLFRSLDDVICAAGVVKSVYDGSNTLYKNPENGEFYLLLQKAENSAEQFNRTCNMLSEYAFSCKFTIGMDAHLGEHMELIIAGNALQTLAMLK